MTFLGWVSSKEGNVYLFMDERLLLVKGADVSSDGILLGWAVTLNLIYCADPSYAQSFFLWYTLNIYCWYMKPLTTRVVDYLELLLSFSNVNIYNYFQSFIYCVLLITKSCVHLLSYFWQIPNSILYNMLHSAHFYSQGVRYNHLSPPTASQLLT